MNPRWSRRNALIALRNRFGVGRSVGNGAGSASTSCTDIHAASGSPLPSGVDSREIAWVDARLPGLSDRIRARSVLGRFLEHSRIYRFGSAARGHEY